MNMPSDEPNPKMDKMLRDYAKKRREAAGPLEMHAATRRMLQGEVLRTLGKTAPVAENRTPNLLRWRKLIWAGAALAIVAMVLLSSAPFLSNSKRQPTQLAAAKSVAPEMSYQPVAAPAPAAAPAYESADYATFSKDKSPPSGSGSVETGSSSRNLREAGKSEDMTYKYSRDDKVVFATNGLAFDTAGGGNFADHLETKPKSLAVGDQAAAALASSSHLVATDTFFAPDKGRGFGNGDPDRALGSAVVSTRTATAAVTTNFFALNEREKDSLALRNEPAKTHVWTKTEAAQVVTVSGAGGQKVLSQNYVQQDLRANYRQNLQSPPQPNVLSNFQVVWNDSNLKIIDADGSVYEGEIKRSSVASQKTTIDTVSGRVELPVKKPGALFDGEKQNIQNVSFRVSGENRTLNRQIVFEGTNLVLPQTSFLTGLAKEAKVMSTPEQTKSDAKKKSSSESRAVQNVIEGSVDVGGTNQYRIQALEAP
ncbi:MAG: hypothetical protein JWM68_3690 [Verrucomicrobiales bacterium]|nr:hypothetical protein [Verrucomicrobiales bacterium]